MAGGVRHREGATGGVAQQVDAVPPEVRAQCLDIVDESVAPVAGRIGRSRRPAGAAQVEQHERAVRGQPAQVVQVGRRLHRPAGQTDQRLTSPANR
jgi:hypothetical protein